MCQSVQIIDDTKSNARSTSSTTMGGGFAYYSGSESNLHSTFTWNSEKGNEKTCTSNFETIQKLSWIPCQGREPVNLRLE